MTPSPLILTLATAGCSASRLHRTSGDRVSLAPLPCSQATWCRRVFETNGRTIRGRRLYGKFEQGSVAFNISTFTWGNFMTYPCVKYADPVLDKLDTHRVVAHRLFRESCFNHKGNYVKVGIHLVLSQHAHHCCRTCHN